MLARVALGVIAAGLTFIPVCRQIREADAEAWVAYFLAFQNGFLWEAVLSAVVKQFTAWPFLAAACEPGGCRVHARSVRWDGVGGAGNATGRRGE